MNRYCLLLETKYWKYSSKIIFKCVNSIVESSFKVIFAEKSTYESREQCIGPIKKMLGLGKTQNALPKLTLRPYSSKFQALKRIKRKEKLELFGSCTIKAKPDLGKNGKLLKKDFDVLTSLSMCIFSSHSSNPRLTSHETLIPKNHSIWMRKASYNWAYALLVLDLILSIFVGPFTH